MPESTVPPIFDSLDIAVTLHDPVSGELIDVNQTYATMFDYSRDAMRRMTIADISADGSSYTQERARKLVESAADGNPQKFEWHAKTAKNEHFWASVRLHAATVEGSKYVIATVRNSTEVKRRERQLQLFHRVLRHNLRNYMNVISGYSRRLRESLDDERVQEDLEIITETASEVASLSRAATTIDEIANPSMTELTPTDASTVIDAVATQIRTTYPEATIDIESRAEAVIHGPSCLRTALEQLVENAIVHNDTRSPTVQITTRRRQSTDEVLIDVMDDGPGIPKSERVIFTAPVPKSDVTHGNGMGLWTVIFCVDSLGGQIDYDQREPRGSRVRLTLPQIPAETTS